MMDVAFVGVANMAIVLGVRLAFGQAFDGKTVGLMLIAGSIGAMFRWVRK